MIILPLIVNGSFLHEFFACLLLLSSLGVVISQNPVYSVLYLISAFANAAAILFIFNVEFLGLIFIIIYVGAIAILFLFVVMMLNVKIDPSTTFRPSPIILLFGFILALQISLVVEQTLSNSVFWQTDLFFNFNNSLDSLGSIDVIGQTLYNNFLLCFLLTGLILLVAMVGAIVLTLNFSSHRKTELFARQLSRSNTFLSFFSK
jgi:NADH-quinone oxidoreductase subunit J